MAASEFQCTPEVIFGNEGFRYRLEAPLSAIEAGTNHES
jgi:hypothetical protein